MQQNIWSVPLLLLILAASVAPQSNNSITSSSSVTTTSTASGTNTRTVSSSSSQSSAAITISGSSSSFVGLREQIQAQAAEASAAAEGSGSLDAILQNLGVAIAQSVATGMVDLLENPDEDAQSIAALIASAIQDALQTASESSDRLSGLDAEAVGSEVESTIITILTEGEGSSQQELTQQVAQSVLDIVGNAFTEITGGTFSATIDVSATSTAAPISFSSVSVDVSQSNTQIIESLEAGEVNEQLIQLLISLLANGGTQEFAQILTQFSTGDNRQFLIQLLIRGLQNVDFPAWAFVNALVIASEGNADQIATILADVIEGSQEVAPQLSEALVYAVSNVDGDSLVLFNLALSIVGGRDNGCENLRVPLTAAQQLAIERGVAAQLLEVLNGNQAISECLREGVQLTIQLELLGTLDNPERVAGAIRDAAIAGESNQIATTLIEGLNQEQFENFQLTLEFVFQDEDVPIDTLTRSLATVSNIGGIEAGNAVGDVFVSFSSQPELQNRLVLMFRYAFSQGSPEIVTAFTDIVTSTISDGECEFEDVLQDALSVLTGEERVQFLTSIAEVESLKTCLGDIPEGEFEVVDGELTFTVQALSPVEVMEVEEATVTDTEETSPGEVVVVEAEEPTPTSAPTESGEDEEPAITVGEGEDEEPATTTTEGDEEETMPTPTPATVESEQEELTTTTEEVDEPVPSTATESEEEEEEDTASGQPQGPSLFSIASESEILSFLVEAIISAQFQDLFSSPTDEFTVFAPTNTAFNRLAKDLGVAPTDLFADTTQLTQILSNHVVEGRVPRGQLENGQELTSLEGSLLTLTINGQGTSVATVGSTANIDLDNVQSTDSSVVYIVDEVLLPFKKPELPNVLERVGEFGRLSTFVQALDTAGFSFPQNVFTIFVPTNQAFQATLEKLGIDIDALLSDTDNLVEILSNHIVPSRRVRSDEFFNGQDLTTLADGVLSIGVSRGDITVTSIGGEGVVSDPDIYSANAIIHIIDDVLLPFAVPEEPSILDVVSSGTVTTADTPNVVDEDEEETPDLTTAAVVEASATAVTTESESPQKSIIDALQENDISLLFQAILRAGIEEDLSDGSQSLTMFAPTTRAFETLFEELDTTLEDLDSQELVDILLQHVVPEQYLSSDLEDGMTLPSLVGGDLTIGTTRNGRLTVASPSSRATITTPDIIAGNSVVHVINTVLLPGGEEEEEVEEPVCTDVAPDDAYTCAQQKDFGKCGSAFILDGGFCQQTCGTCPSLGSGPILGVEEAGALIEGVITEAGVCGCTCDEDKMRAMMREVMTEVLEEYLS